MNTIHLNQQTFGAALAKTRQWLADLPYILLIQRFMTVRLVLLVSLLLVAVAVVVSLLYIPPASPPRGRSDRPIVVQTDTIDELEEWLEEQQGEEERTIVPDQRAYFNVE